MESNKSINFILSKNNEVLLEILRHEGHEKRNEILKIVLSQNERILCHLLGTSPIIQEKSDKSIHPDTNGQQHPSKIEEAKLPQKRLSEESPVIKEKKEKPEEKKTTHNGCNRSGQKMKGDIKNNACSCFIMGESPRNKLLDKEEKIYSDKNIEIIFNHKYVCENHRVSSNEPTEKKKIVFFNN